MVILFTSSASLSAKGISNLDRYKAATILNMIKYIDIGKDSDIGLCIAGSDGVKSVIEGYLKKRPSDKISGIKHFKTPNREISKCDFLYISSNKNSFVSKSVGLASKSKHPLVTISDIKSFIKNNGGLIEIFEDKGRVRFALDLKKAKSNKIRINSKLIETASKIY